MKHAFDKFINQEKNSKKKEAFKQEKRRWKEEKRKKYEERDMAQKADGRRYEAADTKQGSNQKPDNRNVKVSGKVEAPAAKLQAQNQGEMPLNKFIAHSGICGRREAAEMVKEGKIKVNNNIIYEPGFKVISGDKIIFNNKQLHLQKNLAYILLNKPKDYITTSKDTHGRKTVFDLVQQATNERIYPVGRLDRNTTGVLLLTNDGELTQKLTHPSYEIKKIYEAKLDKPLLKKDMEAIITGIELEDGFITADAVSYADKKDKSLIGIEIHSGRNRIVRRIFEHLGYDVKGLDRVLFANLTKKNIDRGKWRHLSEKEVRLLKYMNQSFVKKKTEPKAAKAQTIKKSK